MYHSLYTKSEYLCGGCIQGQVDLSPFTRKVLVFAVFALTYLIIHNLNSALSESVVGAAEKMCSRGKKILKMAQKGSNSFTSGKYSGVTSLKNVVISEEPQSTRKYCL
ncbi:hypothetical protein ILUMI_14365 [Ignelater luminosus]|uniref:Uncharacterized protein n=1 Tax=Ignelater luminosus TaxID=2038154 RepID=A0A8K0GB04_IGNLU|nr:hypothetical protein ILUMI_14365 [Ignelater luminosus]